MHCEVRNGKRKSYEDISFCCNAHPHSTRLQELSGSSEVDWLILQAFYPNKLPQIEEYIRECLVIENGTKEFNLFPHGLCMYRLVKLHPRVISTTLLASLALRCYDTIYMYM